MRTLRSLALVAAACLAAGLLAACGSDDDPAGVTPAASVSSSAPAGTTPAPAATTSAKPSFPAGSTMAQIVSRGTLRIASTRDRPLVRYLDPISNKLSGFEIDLMQELSRRLFGEPNKFEIVDTEFASRIPSVQQGVVDMSIAGFFVTPERAQVVDFSDIYYPGGVAALVPANSTIRSKADLNGKRLIVTKATAAETTAKQLFPSSALLALDSVPLGFEALRSGRGDALIGGDDLLIGLAASQSGYRMLSDYLACSPIAIVLKKGDSSFVDFVNQALRDWKSSGGWQKSWQASYGQFVTGAAPAPPPNTNNPEAICPA